MLFLKIFLYKLRNFLVPSLRRNTFYLFFHPNPPSLRCFNVPLISFKILRSSIPRTRLTVVVHRPFINPRNYPLTRSQPGCRKEAACAPWKRRQLVGWQREIGSTRSSQPTEPTLRGWRKGLEDGASTTRSTHPPRWGWKPVELLPSGSEWGPKRARSGQNNVKSALPTPGRNFRSPLLSPSPSRPYPFSPSSASSSCARQHRYPTASLKYLSSPGGLTLVKWYRDTWIVELLIFRSKPLENSPSSRLKYRSK